MKQEKLICEFCDRQVDLVSRHHLVPLEEGGRYSQTVALCQPCHSTIHLVFSNRELALNYHTIPALKAAEPLQKYLNWVRKKPVTRLQNRRKPL